MNIKGYIEKVPGGGSDPFGYTSLDNTFTPLLVFFTNSSCSTMFAGEQYLQRRQTDLPWGNCPEDLNKSMAARFISC